MTATTAEALVGILAVVNALMWTMAGTKINLAACGCALAVFAVLAAST